MTEEKKYFTYIDTVTGNKDMEKIIIDGVDVAGCCYFFKPDNSCDNAKTTSCYCDKTSCYYKQLQRLKQENEELKKIIFEQGGQKIALETDRYHYVKALEEIRNLCNKGAGVYTNAKVVGLINEVLGNEGD